jgi:hypothetical protein
MSPPQARHVASFFNGFKILKDIHDWSMPGHNPFTLHAATPASTVRRRCTSLSLEHDLGQRFFRSILATKVTMAPEPVQDTDPDDEAATDASPILNLRFYPTNLGSDDEETSDFFEDANDDSDYDVTPQPPASILKTGEKTVKFADEIMEESDAARDKDRNRKELLAKIARLTDMLKDAEKAVEVEKEKRKKKEKNLFKLAKELKKRNLKRESDLERIEEVRL